MKPKCPVQVACLSGVINLHDRQVGCTPCTMAAMFYAGVAGMRRPFFSTLAVVAFVLTGCAGTGGSVPDLTLLTATEAAAAVCGGGGGGGGGAAPHPPPAPPPPPRPAPV